MAGGQFTMVSKWMANGNLKEFIKARQHVNRYELVSSSPKPRVSQAAVDDHYNLNS